jgi:hypothetical protein
MESEVARRRVDRILRHAAVPGDVSLAAEHLFPMVVLIFTDYWSLILLLLQVL